MESENNYPLVLDRTEHLWKNKLKIGNSGGGTTEVSKGVPYGGWGREGPSGRAGNGVLGAEAPMKSLLFGRKKGLEEGKAWKGRFTGG